MLFMSTILSFDTIFGFQRFFKGLAVYVPGKMHWAFAINGVPSGRVGTAEELNLQAHARGGFFDGTADDFQGRLPGGTTGCSPHDGHGCDFSIHNLDIEFRGTEPVPVLPQTILPGKPASGGRSGHPVDFHFFT
jgi:hypothetical protein